MNEKNKYVLLYVIGILFSLVGGAIFGSYMEFWEFFGIVMFVFGVGAFFKSAEYVKGRKQKEVQKMREYKVFKLSNKAKDTEKELNELASEGWKLICSYAENNNWLIMERKKE